MLEKFRLPRSRKELTEAETDQPTEIEPAIRPDGHPLSPVYWEDARGVIVGPAIPEFVARVGETVWIVTTYEGLPRWINSDRLRSQHQFDTQSPIRTIEPVQEPHTPSAARPRRRSRR